MKSFKENINLSLLFIHTDELIFGSIRRLICGNDKSDAAINSIMKQQISKIFKNDKVDPIYVSGRIDSAEENIDDIASGWKFELCQINEDCIHDKIVLLLEEELNI